MKIINGFFSNTQKNTRLANTSRVFGINEFTKEDIINLLSIYLSEWKHRDELLWKEEFKFFYATLIILFLPNIASYLKIVLPNIPSIVFPILALLLSLVFTYVSIGYAKRLEASDITCQRMMNFLPKELRRISINEFDHGKFFSARMSIILSILVFFGLSVLSAVMIVYYTMNP